MDSRMYYTTVVAAEKQLSRCKHNPRNLLPYEERWKELGLFSALSIWEVSYPNGDLKFCFSLMKVVGI